MQAKMLTQQYNPTSGNLANSADFLLFRGLHIASYPKPQRCTCFVVLPLRCRRIAGHNRNGRTIVTVTLGFPKDQQIQIVANRIMDIPEDKDLPKHRRLEGDIEISTLRGKVSTTLLKMDGKDAFVEYVTPAPRGTRVRKSPRSNPDRGISTVVESRCYRYYVP
jgi:hypothetical protein